MKMLDETPCKATPREELRNQIMSSIIPKNEREWWAKRTIEQIERELNAANQRIKQLESWIESLEVLEQHSGILPEREWFGSEIGYLRKGEAVYKGEAKP